MNKKILVLSVLFLFLIMGCVAKQQATVSAIGVMDPQYWKAQAIKDIIPFWEKTIDEDNGGFYTDVTCEGQVEAGSKLPRMNSRVVFGFTAAYMLSGDEKYLRFAEHGMKYLSDTGWDKENGGWYAFTDDYGGGDMGAKNMFDQTYGNLGPVFYYIATGDKKALELAGQTHTLMKKNAWDEKYGGYYTMVDNQWQNITTAKSFNAQLDTCTAYLIYYYLATGDKNLLQDLIRLCDVIAEKMVDKKTGFVGESYTGDWTGKDVELWGGHNTKTGWVMMRMYYLTGNKEYLTAARKIDSAQRKYMWDKKHGGWFFKFISTRPASIDDSKDWWTQEEGNNLMLNMYYHSGDKKYIEIFKKSAEFWDKYFMDKTYGECYETLLADGTPSSRVKGTMYKSAYHTMEQALFNYLYLSLYVHKKDAELYFNLSSQTEGQKHYVNILEAKEVKIKSVEINGKAWEKFEDDYVILPKGNNMKVKAVFGIK